VFNARVHPWASAARPLFDADGNRQPRTGEHVVWLRPNFSGDRLDLSSTISVWEVRPRPAGPTWRLVAAHQATYNQPRPDAE
jgi:acyl dehydratase